MEEWNAGAWQEERIVGRVLKFPLHPETMQINNMITFSISKYADKLRQKQISKTITFQQRTLTLPYLVSERLISYCLKQVNLDGSNKSLSALSTLCSHQQTTILYIWRWSFIKLSYFKISTSSYETKPHKMGEKHSKCSLIVEIGVIK